MKTKLARLISMLVLLCTVLTSCATANMIPMQIPQAAAPGNTRYETVTPAEAAEPTTSDLAPTGAYNEGVVLVKYEDPFNDRILEQLNFTSAEPLYTGSTWYKIQLADGEDTKEAVTYLNKLGCFEKVDYDYIMGADAEEGSVDISGNSFAPNPQYLETLGVKDAWENSAAPGGVSDVIVAVIDTGVDYNHLDLHNNIWVNTAEIPNNGIDDDGNGYVDDYYGWNFVGNNKDPMDDNGHGTHVAGIIAAENNDIGTVGIAFNCKVMCLKAGNSSGYFKNSDIAAAIQYAYMNGASVINMSFGGSSISLAVEDALQSAYSQCVLVAAAGNDTLCNNTSHLHPTGISYPAALSYVIGVMSCDQSGSSISSFSNYDDTPYNTVEYEVYAPGEAIPSTFPGNKYATLNGTSMACPTVAGIAALLRASYPDREAFSTKFLQSQIVNTGKLHPVDSEGKKDTAHSVVHADAALRELPQPSVSLYDSYIFDDVSYSPKNNGDGRIDAGETIRIGVELMNRGGVAKDVTVTLDTIRNGDPALTDPYMTITKKTVMLTDIGTYSVRTCGLRKEDGKVVGTDACFEIVVSEDCPNDYRCTFNLRFSYRNGMDETDNADYAGESSFDLTVTNGIVLDASYTEDTVFPGNRRYIVAHDVIIAEGVTVTFEAGAILQFYENSQGYYDTLYNTPTIYNYGTLYFNGTKDAMIDIGPSELFENYLIQIECPYPQRGKIIFSYCNIHNIALNKNVSSYGS